MDFELLKKPIFYKCAVPAAALIGILIYSFPWLEAKFLLHDKFLSFLAVIISVLTVITGWFVNSAKTRNLQRKQLAVSILNDNRYEPKWVDAKHSIWSKIHDPNFTKDSWKDLLLKSIDNSVTLDYDENSLWRDLRVVLNSFEFASMAVNCKAANEYVVEQSWSHFFETLYSELIEGITAIRAEKRQPNLYINFTCMTEKWFPDIKPKEGQPSTKII